MKITAKAHLLACLIGLLAMLAVPMAIAADARAAYEFNMPEQALSEALKAIGQQTTTNILFDPQSVQDRTAPALRATLTVKQAIEYVLQGTDLIAKQSAIDTVLVRPLTENPLSAAERSERRTELEEVVVTGTNIRGIDNATVPVLVFDREDLERTGYSTIEQFVDNLPQNFGGGGAGASEDGVIGVGAARDTNFTAASGINLRGLGNSSTLVLLDGRRLPPAAGSFVDVSTIPLAAVERIEVLTDGSSAIYGADGIAGVVNLILRKDYEGVESRVRYGLATQQDTPTELQVGQAFGQSWNAGNALLTLQYREREALSVMERDFSADKPPLADLLPKTEQLAATLSARQQLGAFELFGNTLYSDKSIDRRTQFTVNDPRVSSADGETVSATLGTAYQLSGDWRIEAAVGYGRDDASNTGTQLLLPALGASRINNRFDIRSADFKGDGSLFALPGGAARLAIGAGYREEQLDQYVTSGSFAIDRQFSREVKSGFAELHVPLVGPDNARPGMRRLELSLAARTDDYSDFGSAANPRYGLLWSPIESLQLRGAYSTSSRAPTASEQFIIAMTPALFIVPFVSPTGPGEVPVFVLNSGSPLTAEESENITAGLAFSPSSLRDLRLSINYYAVDYTNRIFLPSFNSRALLQPEIYGPLITSLASAAEAQAFLAAHLAAGGTFNAVGNDVNAVRNIYDLSMQNISILEQSGFDVGIAYNFRRGANGFLARLNAAFIDEIVAALGPGATATDLVDTYANPIGFRARANLGWSRGGLQVNAGINYSDSYNDNAAIVPARVSSWTTVDLSVRYALPRLTNMLNGVSMNLAAINVFDQDPPFAVGQGALTYGYDAANADPSGRVIAFEIRKEW